MTTKTKIIQIIAILCQVIGLAGLIWLRPELNQIGEANFDTIRWLDAGQFVYQYALVFIGVGLLLAVINLVFILKKAK